MPVDRKLWRSTFAKDHVPLWPCPRCGAAALHVVEGTLHSRPSAQTLIERKDDYGWQPEFDTGVFSALLGCARKDCLETCTVSGLYEVVGDADETGQFTVDVYRPRSFCPTPAMIRLPDKFPNEIHNEVTAAFKLYWCDYGASLNRIRQAIELVLTEMGVKRYGKKRGGGRSLLTLDSRIQVLESKKPSLADLCNSLRAVKHLGNAGSHPGDVEQDDVFDGLDILEDIPLERYDNSQGRLAKMVRAINKRKKPRGNKK